MTLIEVAGDFSNVAAAGDTAADLSFTAVKRVDGDRVITSTPQHTQLDDNGHLSIMLESGPAFVTFPLIYGNRPRYIDVPGTPGPHPLVDLVDESLPIPPQVERHVVSVAGLSGVVSAQDLAAAIGTGVGGQPSDIGDIDGLQDALSHRVLDTDPRLTNPRTPTSHQHSQSEITGLTAALAGKVSVVDLGVDLAPYALLTDPRLSDARAPLAHVHSQTDITGLSAALAAKANASSLATKADLVGGVIPTSQIAAQTSHETVPVQTSAQRFALTLNDVQPGDNVIQYQDPGRGTYALIGTTPSSEASWALQVSPTDVVSSVNGQTGLVVLGKSDVGLGNVTNTSDANKPVSTAQATALTLKADQTALDAEVTARGTAVTAEATARANADALKANTADLTAETTARVAADALKANSSDLTAETSARTAADLLLTPLTDSRLTDYRRPILADRGAWAANTPYLAGDSVSFAGIRWSRLADGTSGSTFVSTNWVATGRTNDQFTAPVATTWTPPRHASGATMTSVAGSANNGNAIRFGFTRACTITGLGIEVTAASTTGTAQFSLLTFDPVAGTITTSGVDLGSITDLTTLGFKSLTGLNLSVNAGDHIAIGLTSRTATSSLRRFLSADPYLLSLGLPLIAGVTGWTGTNLGLSSPSYSAQPLIHLMTT